jgi:hypothetical protein
MYVPAGVRVHFVEHAMPPACIVSLSCVISTSLSRTCGALSTPLSFAISAAAPISTSPLPGLQPP